MYKAIILPLAKVDIKEAATWYKSKRDGLGKRFTREVRSKVALLKQNPRISGVRYDKVRTTVLDVFPFMIHYTVDEEKKTIIVAAVFHTSLNPAKWMDRR